ncbi:MAG TPA: hypothetical protein VFG86_08160 [Chloroflexota bacterium]|nr:hypothetical protein [Chloroflexota bacterium]
MQVEVAVLQRGSAGFDLGQVQHLVDQRVEVLAALQDDREFVSCLRRQVTPAHQQPGEAQHRIER